MRQPVMSSCTESARRNRDCPSPWRDAPRRAALPFRVGVYYDGLGKGGNAARGFYRSRDRRHARFRRPTSPAAAEGGRESGRRDEGTILRHDVASHHSASPEITRREAPSLAARVPLANSLYSGLIDVPNKYAWTKSGTRVP